jgi:hypothetical protein
MSCQIFEMQKIILCDNSFGDFSLFMPNAQD